MIGFVMKRHLRRKIMDFKKLKEEAICAAGAFVGGIAFYGLLCVLGLC